MQPMETKSVLRPLLAAAVLFAAVMPVQAASPEPEGDLRGVWKPTAYIAALKTADGKAPPLLPKAASLLQQRVADRKKGKAGDPLDQCLPAGTPRAMYQMRPFMIVQTPVKVTIVMEQQHLIRHVYLNEPHSWDETTWQGASIGHWDKGSLVIETEGFNGKTWLDEAGLPMSEKTKVTERYTRTGPAAMTGEITIEDPEHFSKAWTTKLNFQLVPNGELAHHVCTEKMFPMPPNARPKAPAGS